MRRTSMAATVVLMVFASVMGRAEGSMRAADVLVPLRQPVVRLVRALSTPVGRADVATSVVPLSGGGAVIAGWTKVEAGGEDGLLIRVNDEGEVVWRREFGGKGEDLFWSVQPDDTGGFVCAGYTSSAGAGEADGWLVRVDDKGEVTWQHTFGQAGEDKFFALQRAGEGWIAAGQTAGRGAGGIDALVVRIDKAGKEISSIASGGPELDRAFAVVAMKDGGCAIGGMTGRDREHCNPFVTRLAADGKRVWHRVIDHGGTGVTHDLHAAANGDLLAYGYATAKNRADSDGFAVRLSDAGEVLDEQTFGGATADRMLHARCFDDGSAAVVGYSQRDSAGNPDSLWDLCLYLLDRAGKPTWIGRFGGNQVEFGRAIAGAKNDLWIVGHTASAGAGTNVYVIRVDASS